MIDPATSFAGHAWSIDRVATDLIARGEIEPIIMVAVYNSPDRLHEYNPVDKGYAYTELITSTIMPVIEDSFRAEGGRRSAVMGSSMGGLISLAMLWWRPACFFGAACLSPSLWVLRGAGGPAAWLAKEPPPPPGARLYLDHGTRGSEARGAALAKDAAAFALSAGLRPSDVRYFLARGGEHNEASWGARVDKPLKFLFGLKKRASRPARSAR
jgi:predicted alpha/beta superfamily hydrolase